MFFNEMIAKSNLFKDKRGFDQIIATVIYLIIALVIFAGLLKFVSDRASGDSLKEQVLAKQIALILDTAKPGTEVNITIGSFIVDLDNMNHEVIVKSKPERIGYRYHIFTNNRAPSITKKEDILTIGIS
jgi:hypothetical protein